MMIKTFEKEEYEEDPNDCEESKNLHMSFREVEDFFARRNIESSGDGHKEESKIIAPKEAVSPELVLEEGDDIDDIEEITENFWNEIQSLVSEVSNGCLAAALEDSQ